MAKTVKMSYTEDMSKPPHIYQHVHALRRDFYRMAPGKESLLALIDAAEVAEQVFDSNAIENSTLSLEETEKILLQIDLDRFVSPREIFETKNLARVMEYVRAKALHEPLTLPMIERLHGMLLANIDESIAGRLRQSGEYVRVGSHIAPPPEGLRDALETMLGEFQAQSQEHIIRRLALLHLTFEHLHPFVDGNGRIGRVLNNYLLLREGYVPINIKFADRGEYYHAFADFDRQRTTARMETIVGRALTQSYHKRLAYLSGSPIQTLGDHAKERGLSHSNLLNKAARQTIPAFLEKGVWKIAVNPAEAAT